MTMVRVAALYRHPVKGFRPQVCEQLEILAGGRVAGDRVLGFRFANAPTADDEWGTKHEFAVGVNTPAIACLTAALNATGTRLRIQDDSGHLIAEGGLDPVGRNEIAAVLGHYLAQTPDNPLAAHPERLPLRLVGHPDRPCFQDSQTGQTTLHSRASVAALGMALDVPALDERRFRTNISIEGIAAWEELDWVGRQMQIGDVVFEVVTTKVRCAATQANPESGRRDLPVLRTLVDRFGQEKPTLAIGMLTQVGGHVRVGDEVRLLG